MKARQGKKRGTAKPAAQWAGPTAYCTILSRLCHTDCVAEYRFHPARRWRFDYALPAVRLAVEIDGGAWMQGRHNRAAGFIADMAKLNAAAEAGWRVLRFTPQQQWTTAAIDTIVRTATSALPPFNETPG